MPRAWATWSLRRRLALIATFAMCMALIVGGLAMYSAARIEENQMLDARLEQLGSTIASFADDELPAQHSLAETEIRTRPTAALLYRYQVWTREGRLVLRSHEAPANKSWVGLKQFGFSTVSYDGEEYRTFTLPSSDGQFVIQVAECLDEHIDQLVRVTAYYVGFLVLPFGLILLTTWLLLRRALGSIQSIATQLTNRNPLDVTPLRVRSPPEEMLPILHSLDELFTRVRQAISVERRFTSVAAHEMRTPLAGLRAHAQLAVTATNPQDARASLDALMQGVDRASDLLTQLLDIAKIEALSDESAPRLEPVALKPIYVDIVKDLTTAAMKKGVVITEDVRVTEVLGLPFGIFLMLRNLLANAVLYCPPGGSVRFETDSERGRVVFTVDDSGPGIPVEDRARAFERFNRLGQYKTRGVGLGLSIVLMAVELHNAKISLLDSPLGGLRCKVVFGEPVVEPEGLGPTQRLVSA